MVVNTAPSLGGAAVLPEIGHDRLAGGQPAKAVERHRELGRADVLAKSEERVVLLQVIDGGLLALVDLDLLDAGIALDIEDAVALEQVLVEFLRAADVQDGIGLPVELDDALLRQPGALVRGQVARAIGPAAFKPKFARPAFSESPPRNE